jgi:hypothetical protein
MDQSRKEREVWEACEVLESQQEKLTYKAIGDKLVEMGHCRGSNSDICRYLSTWKISKGYADNMDAPRPPSHHLFPPSQKDIWPVLEQIQQHLRQLDDKVEKLSKQKSAALRAAQPSTSTHPDQQDWLKETLSLSTGPLATKADLDALCQSQAQAFVRLFEHHEMLFDKYLGSLEVLRKTNAHLVEKVARLEARHSEAEETFIEE